MRSRSDGRCRRAAKVKKIRMTRIRGLDACGCGLGSDGKARGCEHGLIGSDHEEARGCERGLIGSDHEEGFKVDGSKKGLDSLDREERRRIVIYSVHWIVYGSLFV